MKSRKLIIPWIFCGLTKLTFVLCLYTTNCPTGNDVLPLDINQFLGEWFVVSGTPVSGKSMSKCGRFVVEPSTPDTFTMNYTAVSHRRNNPVAFAVNARLDNDDVIGNWQLRGSNRILGPFKHRVIAVDYNSYFVMIVCGIDNPDLPRKQFSMIWSRGTTLSSTILHELKNKLKPYFKDEDILDVDQKNC